MRFVFVVIVMAVFVLPKFKTFFADFDAKLPLPTRMLLGITDLFAKAWPFYRLLVIADLRGEDSGAQLG